ncbi:hypothetical protein ABEV34_06845 [Methylorubrum rhodesianum]|uniref:hypothetical protein n=1 Tax=Methylorubrum TaxID=2282523 RepID=UPI001609A767|nr:MULTISPECIES: hypothetical protein [Methylorubrum]MBB5765689.1 hypothetical protein [Methylorubrum rhodesianum]MBI1691542.1 hypothetical protein [Methylorubrum sp. DB1722]
MLTFDSSSFDVTARAVDRAGKQARFVAAFALTNAMKDAREGEIGTMRSVFDRPTRFTLNSLQVRPATKQNLTATLGFKEGHGSVPAWKYLGPHVAGGPRRRKRFEMLLIRHGIMLGSEFAVPARAAPLDGSGNVSGAFITRMLSALGAQSDRMQNTARRPTRSNRKRNLDYFVLRGTKAPNGIYLRQGRSATPVFIFVNSANYKKRFPYYEKAQAIVPAAFRKHFAAGWDRFVLGEMRRAA